jgi:hypothetical protein
VVSKKGTPIAGTFIGKSQEMDLGNLLGGIPTGGKSHL